MVPIMFPPWGFLNPIPPRFFAFMLVMVMVLLNMLVAILMEAYGVVKEDAKNADSLRLGLFL